MIAAGMGYALAIALLFTIAALAAERLLALRRWPRRSVWAVALTMSVALPCIAIFLDGSTAPAEMHFAEDSVRFAAGPDAPAAGHATSALRMPPPAWLQPSVLDSLLIKLWMLVSGGMLLFLAAASLRFRRALRDWAIMRIEGKSVSVADRAGPAVFGIVNPRIIIPRWLLDAHISTRSMVLKHEQAHIAARDPLLLALALLLVALVPWNLPLWWQLRRLRFAVEVDCDARVLRQGIDPAIYGETLLSVGQHRSTLPLSAIAGAVALIEPVSQLERRIRIMLLEKNRYSVLLTTALLGLGAASVVCATQLQPPEVHKDARVETNKTIAVPESAILLNVGIYRDGKKVASPAVATLFGKPATIEISGLMRLQLTAIDVSAEQVDLLVRVRPLTGQPEEHAASASEWPPSGPTLRVKYGKEGSIELKDDAGTALRVVMTPQRTSPGER